MSGKKEPTSAASKKTPSDLPFASSPAEQCPTQAEAAAMLAYDMNQLSVEEREKVFEDVHGVAPVRIDEPQEVIDASLALLEKELANISSKAAYDLASSMSKEYTSSNKIRLMFLRAESFDAYKAASRMVKFFDEKYKLFGAEKLTKDIVLADLDPDDIAALENGFYQLLPEKDTAGRKVCCFFPKLRVVRTIQNVLRAYYYMFMSNVEDDDEAQKRGVVGCTYGVGGDLKLDLQIVRETIKLRNTLPVTLVSAHVCYNDLRMVPLFSLAMFLMEGHTRTRFRVHYGSHEECQSQLSSFGIPISALPVNSRGEFNLENHRTYMAMQRASETEKAKRKGPPCVSPQKYKKTPEEKAPSRQPITKEDFLLVAPQPNQPTVYGGLMGFSNNCFPSFASPWWSVAGAPNMPSVMPPHNRELPATPSSDIITGPMSASRSPAKFCNSPAKLYVISDPLPNDILFGRGKPIQYRPANVRFRKMLDCHLEKYGKGENCGKVFAPVYMVNMVKEEGGRFLKELEVGGGWVEVDEDTAKAKVSQAFRSRRQVFQATFKKDKSTT